MDRQPVLEGERLILRPLEAGDLPALYAVACDPLIWEQHPMNDRWREDVFREYFEALIARAGSLVVTLREDGEIAGSSTYSNYRAEGGGAVEIGSTFLGRRWWGGTANREMKRLMLRHALGHVDRVEFLIGEHNLRSRRAIEKIGGRLTDRIRAIEHHGTQVDHLIYEIDRAGFAGGPLGS